MCRDAVGYEARIYLTESAVLLGMPLAAEIGFRWGLALHRRHRDAVASQIGVVQATTFAILGLLAAFTMSMAETRFSARRQLIIDEANAIGTSYLRSRYLAEPHASALAPLFRRYVDSRVAFYAVRDDAAAIVAEIATTKRLQRAIWDHAIVVVRDEPTHGDTNASFVEAVNLMINLENARVAAVATHVPATVLALVALMGLAACATTGYAGGLGGTRAWLALLMLPLLVGCALCVTLDLDSPRLGLITTGQLPMERLQRSLHEDTEHAARPTDPG